MDGLTEFLKKVIDENILIQQAYEEKCKELENLKIYNNN